MNIYVAVVEHRDDGRDRAILTTRDPQFIRFLINQLLLQLGQDTDSNIFNPKNPNGGAHAAAK